MKVFTLICFQCNYRTRVHWFYWEWNDSYHKNQIKGVGFCSIKIKVSYGRSRCSPVSTRWHSSHKTEVLNEYDIIVRAIRWYKRHVAIDTDFKQIERTIFLPRYFNGIKIVTAFKRIFEETLPKLSVNFGNHISQATLIRTNIPAPSVISVFCTTIQWQMLIKFAAEMPYLFMLPYHLCNHPIYALEPVTTCWYGSKIKHIRFNFNPVLVKPTYLIITFIVDT